ncbi:PIN domain-containing protein [Parerythrobacter lacustris]|uniref:PIN domain-containing protein n=1 Tax=Parerythrobacter lacustris TaxID=2969984 RepID=A0ABT1XRL4_9SPHN|nr:PIN domain-containing protein [Parerythrobacter lacustris]
MAERFLDTNVLLYAAAQQAAAADSGKHQQALNLIGEGGFAISAQVLQEFYVNATRLKPQPLHPSEAKEWVDLLGALECVAVDHRLVSEGVQISQLYQTSYWDGAIIAAAHAAGATALYSEDLNHGQVYGDVTVINPFKSSTH